MNPQQVSLRERFDQYIAGLLPGEDEHLQWIQAETERQQMPVASIQPFEGALLAWLVRLCAAETAVEVGTLAGYSGTWIARALPAHGKLYTIDKRGSHVQVARDGFKKGGLAHKVEVLQGEALPMLENLTSQGPFGFVFIDANKDRDTYLLYLNWALENLKSGGIVAAHNAFRRGMVMEPRDEGDHVMDIINQMLMSDPRVDGMIIPMGDGMAVGVKQ